MSEREPHYADISLDQLPAKARHPVHVVLDNIRSAFNVGSIFRTSDAALVEKIHLCGMSAYPPNPKLAKTALGATDYVPWEYAPRAVDVVRRLQSEGVTVVAVEVTDAAVSHLEYDWPEPVAIVFGHEVRGILPAVLDACDAHVQIPMLGYKNTVNVATAFGVVLYEILRKWGRV
ncbi:RNA methyltransferase [bacterium]|nr:RNA methyltransferase [bacterium]